MYAFSTLKWTELLILIQACAPLDVNSALEYFKYSPWYAAEPLSTNAQWRMQNTGIEVGERNEMEELKSVLSYRG
jgi:hypothetical protein